MATPIANTAPTTPVKPAANARPVVQAPASKPAMAQDTIQLTSKPKVIKLQMVTLPDTAKPLGMLFVAVATTLGVSVGVAQVLGLTVGAGLIIGGGGALLVAAGLGLIDILAAKNATEAIR